MVYLFILMLGVLFSVVRCQSLSSEECQSTRKLMDQCYRFVFSSKISPMKSNLIRESLLDDDIATAIAAKELDVMGQMIDLINDCRKLDPSYDSCARATPLLPAIPKPKLAQYCRAKYDCMKQAQDKIITNQEEEMKEMEKCYVKDIPSTCYANTSVIECYEKGFENIKRGMVNKAYTDNDTKMAVDVEIKVGKFFDDPQNQDKFKVKPSSFMCMFCRPDQSALTSCLPEAYDTVRWSCIADTKQKLLLQKSRIINDCITRAGFPTTLNDYKLIMPMPNIWLSDLCLGYESWL